VAHVGEEFAFGSGRSLGRLLGHILFMRLALHFGRPCAFELAGDSAGKGVSKLRSAFDLGLRPGNRLPLNGFLPRVERFAGAKPYLILLDQDRFLRVACPGDGADDFRPKPERVATLFG
jgi:hypothetical protein